GSFRPPSPKTASSMPGTGCAVSVVSSLSVPAGHPAKTPSSARPNTAATLAPTASANAVAPLERSSLRSARLIEPLIQSAGAADASRSYSSSENQTAAVPSLPSSSSIASGSSSRSTLTIFAPSCQAASKSQIDSGDPSAAVHQTGSSSPTPSQ